MEKNKQNLKNIFLEEMSSINPKKNPEELKDQFKSIRQDIIKRKAVSDPNLINKGITAKDMVDYFNKEKETGEYTDADLDKFKEFLLKQHGANLEEIEEKDLDTSNLTLKKGMNPKFWKNDKLSPLVRKALLKITKEYLKFMDLTNVDIKDIVFTGSLANNNYTDGSDVDVHIIMDYNDIGDNKDILMDYFKAKKDAWSAEYPITVHGYPVELFIQDEEAPKDWTAMYSLLNDKWINKPELSDKNIDKQTIKSKAMDIIGEIEKLEELSKDKKNDEEVLKKIETLKEKIKKMRTHGLETGGEMSNENLIFKILRTGKFLDKIYEIKKKIMTDELTLDEFFDIY